MLPEKFDYDLNVFQREVEVPDTSLVDPSEGTVWEYAGPWYIDVYDVVGAGHQEIGMLIELTDTEAEDLALGTGYFDYPDSWYGLEGFLADYGSKLSPRLLNLFNSLPVYREEVLF